MKISFFEKKINKIDKPLFKLFQKKRGKIQINKVIGRKKNITTDIEERNKRIYFKNLYSTELEILKEIDGFLLVDDQLKLNWDEVNKLSITIAFNEIEAVV